MQYKGRSPLYVINYKRTEATEIDQTRYRTLRLVAIKSIYINEELSARCRYADIRMSPMDVDEIYGCAVFMKLTGRRDSRKRRQGSQKNLVGWL